MIAGEGAKVAPFLWLSPSPLVAPIPLFLAIALFSNTHLNHLLSVIKNLGEIEIPAGISVPKSGHTAGRQATRSSYDEGRKAGLNACSTDPGVYGMVVSPSQTDGIILQISCGIHTSPLFFSAASLRQLPHLSAQSSTLLFDDSSVCPWHASYARCAQVASAAITEASSTAAVMTDCFCASEHAG